jgi:hypothetical protein
MVRSTFLGEAAYGAVSAGPGGRRLGVVSHAVHDPAKVILEPTVTLATSEGTTWRTSRCRASTVRETVRLEATSPNPLGADRSDPGKAAGNDTN